MLVTTLHPYAEGESKSRERKNEEMPLLALRAPASVPVAQLVLGLGGLSGEEGRKAAPLLMPEWVLPPISENQNHEAGVCLT